MCSSLNPQKSIRIDAELCDGVQAYALANRLALKPRWFSNFINSAVREKLVREGFLPADITYSHSDGSPSALRDSDNSAVRENSISEGILAGNSTNDTSDGSRRVIGGSAVQGVDSVPSDNCADEVVILGNSINDTSASSRDVLGGSVAQGGGVLVEDKKVLDRIAQSEEPYLAYLAEKNSRADNQDNYPRGFNYPKNPDDKADVPAPNSGKKSDSSESQNREER